MTKASYESERFSGDRLVMLRALERPSIACMKTTALLVMAALVAAACGTRAATTATSSATSSPVPSPSVLPADFVLPQNCSFVGAPIVEQPVQTVVTSWQFDCGAAPDFKAIERLTPVFARQGWTLCPGGGARTSWWKGTLQTSVSQSAVGYPYLTQVLRQMQTCPLDPSYVNSTYKFGLTLPTPYQKSVRAETFTANGGQRPAIQEAFTARTDAEEAAIGNAGCHTACPLWNYAAYVVVNTGTGSETPRQYYASQGGKVGELIEDAIIGGRAAIQVTNGAPYPMQFIVKDGERIFVLAYQIYPEANGMAVPAGASKEKLEQLIASFRFTP